jgi:hypothetical protein
LGNEYKAVQEIGKALGEMITPGLVFIDFNDYKNFSTEQKSEILMFALQKKIKAIIYNDSESKLPLSDSQLAGLKNVLSFRGEEGSAFASYGKSYPGKMIHLSKGVDARAAFDKNKFYFFREQGDQKGTLGAAILYQLADGKLRGVKEENGFLIVDLESALAKLVQEYEASFEVAKAA